MNAELAFAAVLAAGRFVKCRSPVVFAGGFARIRGLPDPFRCLLRPSRSISAFP